MLKLRNPVLGYSLYFLGTSFLLEQPCLRKKEKNQDSSRVSTGEGVLGIEGSYSSILAVVKLVIPKTKVTGHTRFDFPFLQGQVDNADLIYFIL